MDDPSGRTKPDQRGGALRVREALVQVESTGAQARVTATTPVVIGTAETVDLVVDDGTVSRRHARFALTESGLVVTDEGSRNGTWVGAVRVREVLLTENARLRVGNTAITIVFDEESKDLPISAKTRIGDALAFSAPMRHVFSLLERAAPTELTMLLEGESGVGKEVLARAIHGLSPRSEAPFVTVDCGSIPKDLLESELFGHERGAFTGAVGARMGLFEEANGGTIFLDELGELPLALQPKLLRVLEAREVRPVGSNKVRAVDVRVIAATNRNLSEEVKQRTFREDLFYRLSVARVHVPALRDRPGDVDALATAFYRHVVDDDSATLPPDVLDLLRAYRWPGNVRELRNVVSRYAVLGFSGNNLFDERAPRGSNPGARPAEPDASWKGLSYHSARQVVVDRFEAEFVRDALGRAGGVMLRAAELAQMARSSFYRMVEKHGTRADREAVTRDSVPAPAPLPAPVPPPRRR